MALGKRVWRFKRLLLETSVLAEFLHKTYITSILKDNNEELQTGAYATYPFVE